MERLTFKLGNSYGLNDKASAKPGLFTDYDGFYAHMKANNRLGEYEDTNLTPEQITAIQREIEDGTLVRVVRCGECKYSEPLQLHADLYNQDLMNCTCQNGEEAKNVWHKYTKQYKDYSLIEPDNYCSYGERRKPE